MIFLTSLSPVIALATSMATRNAASKGVKLNRSLVDRGQINIYEEAQIKGFQAGCILGSAGVVILCAPYYTKIEKRLKVDSSATTSKTT